MMIPIDGERANGLYDNKYRVLHIENVRNKDERTMRYTGQKLQ